MATAAAAAGGGGGGTALGADLASPIAALPDKWKLLPAFLQARGLVKQHIESFDYFFDTELRNIVEANREVRSDVDPKASAAENGGVGGCELAAAAQGAELVWLAAGRRLLGVVVCCARRVSRLSTSPFPPRCFTVCSCACRPFLLFLCSGSCATRTSRWSGRA